MIHVKAKEVCRFALLPVVTVEDATVGISSNVGSPIIIDVDISAAEDVDILFLQRSVRQHAGEFMPVLLHNGLLMNIKLKFIVLGPQFIRIWLPIVIIRMGVVVLSSALVRSLEGVQPLLAHSEQLLWRAMWMSHHQLNTAKVIKLGRSLHGPVSREVRQDSLLRVSSQSPPRLEIVRLQVLEIGHVLMLVISLQIFPVAADGLVDIFIHAIQTRKLLQRATVDGDDRSSAFLKRDVKQQMGNLLGRVSPLGDQLIHQARGEGQ